MKKITFIILSLVMSVSIYAQESYFNYKAVVSDNDGNLLIFEPLDVQFTIYSAGVEVFQETHATNTDGNGIIVLNIGSENPDWYSIDWANDLKELKTEYNIGSGFVDMGTKPFRFTPYAQFALSSLTTESVDYSNVENAPINVSEFDNDAGYLTTSTDPDQSDADFYEAGGTIPADDITDDIYHLGKMAIGKDNFNDGSSNKDAQVEIENSGNHPSYNLKLENFNSANSLVGNLLLETEHTGSFGYKGINNSIAGSGSGYIEGLSTKINVSNSTDQHVGVYNLLSSTGAGERFGLKNILSQGDGTINGVHSEISSPGNGDQIGTHNDLSGSGSGDHIGTQNVFSGTGNGDQIGIETKNENNGAGTHIGSYNRLFGSGGGSQVAIRNSIDNSGAFASGFHHIGVENSINSSGGDDHIGVLNTLWGANDRPQFGMKNSITNTGNGVHHGVWSELSGIGNGDKYGIITTINNTAGGNHYGIYAQVEKAGSYAGFFVGDVYTSQNIEISGEVHGSVSGNADMKSYIYGHINISGTVGTSSSSDGFSATKIATGKYRVTFDVDPASINYMAIATPISTAPVFITLIREASYFDILIWNTSGVATNKAFTFVVYKK